jgi:alginate O-acetyltransferase complex protein AlgI
MLFSSSVFLFLFLPATLLVYALCPGRARNAVLCLASLFFYAWGEVDYLGVLLASIALNYAFGLWIGASRATAGRWAIGLGIAANCLLLGIFKYAGFFGANANVAFEGLGLGSVDLAPIHLPLGISFFTFQAMSYLIDVHRGATESRRNPLDVALYISMFPQLIAGPIVRYASIADQIKSRRHTLANVDAGLRRFVVGLARKMLLANPLGETADLILATPGGELTAAAAWLGTTCYALQIYFDFSGYSDMAIGLGRVLGFRFPENFDHPYIATSIREFWRRWHMTLSSWFRDYLYIPLGGNRLGPIRTALNLFAVFFLCGLWHGASWNFVGWGLFHGALLTAERIGLGALLERAWRPVRHFYVIAMVWTGWVFFRIEDFGPAWSHLKAMLGLGAGNVDMTRFLDPRTLLCLFVGALFSTPAPARIGAVICERLDATRPGYIASGSVKMVSVLALAGLCAAAVASSSHNPFIYFRF